MKQHFFRRTFILYFIVLLLSIVFVEFYIKDVARDNYIDHLNKSLSVQTDILSDRIPFKTTRNLDELCREFREKTGARVTIINEKGKVLGDSDMDSSVMKNHADRAEIQKALLSGTGWSIRYSDTVGEDLLYFARKSTRNGTLQGFVRLAVPTAMIKRAVNVLRLEINLVVILIFLSSAIIFVWQTDKIRKFVNQIKDYAGSLAHGLFRKRLYLEDAGEFTELAHDLNTMAAELKTSIDKKDEETNRLNVILRNIPDALLIISIHGTVELSNNAARDIFGSSRLDGRPYIEVVRNAAFSSLVDDVVSERRPGSAELVLDTPVEKHLSVRVSPLSYKVGEVAGVVAIFHDTTETKKFEQMRKDFVANVSHEIKTPVTAIQGFAETLLDGALYDRENAEKFLGTIRSHSERLNRLIEDLLTISRLELGVMTIDKSETNIEGVIDNVIRTVVVQAAAKDITVTKSVEKDMEIISADRDRLEQILLNLADNAIKFTQKGEVRIGVTREEGKKYFYVSDTGIGVPDKYVSRLGERFFRVDSSRSRDLGGTGLGLAIVKHLVKAHGWEMKIESEEEKGTTVRIYY